MAEADEERPCPYCNLEIQSKFVVYQDEEYLCFKDNKPNTVHHYLIIPRRHISGIASLRQQDLPLLRRLLKIGKIILQTYKVEMEEARFGFHLPPFTNIEHLHLHAVYPVDETGYIVRHIFKADSYWLIAASSMIKRLERRELEFSDQPEQLLEEEE